MMRSLALAGAAVLLVAAFGCSRGGGRSSGDASKGTPDPPKAATVTFAKDVQPIFSKNCAHPSCHGAAKSAGMQLSEGMAYENTVDVPSSEDPALMRIKPGAPDSSYLVMKIEGRQKVGARMPLIGGPLSDKQIGVIRSWIEAGAKKD